MELLTKLGVDWKLLIAQIVNFTILVSVLTYFVYRPLLDLLDARRERIRKAVEDENESSGRRVNSRISGPSSSRKSIRKWGRSWSAASDRRN